tara:strand:+ start:4654 stop:4869 length:216 start_codon:yes stop_codon:yes gene_type:complete
MVTDQSIEKMTSSSFDKYGLDKAGIHWMQYLSMTSMSLLIFLIALDKAVPSFHHFVLITMAKAGIICNGMA